MDDTWSDYRAKIKALIDKHGWAIQRVVPTVDQDRAMVPFAYTIGLTLTGHPELAMSGNMHAEQLHHILNICARQAMTRPYLPGTQVDVEGLLIPMRVIDAPFAETGIGRRYLSKQPRVLQIVWSDAEGAWPATQAWSGVKARQNLFGPAWWL